MKVRVLSLFSGIGAPEAALRNLGFDVEIVDAVEIDQHAVKSYGAIFNKELYPNDITKYFTHTPLEGYHGDVDIITHGSPCQDISLAGKEAGADKDSGTRSSLLYESIRIIKGVRPKYVLWENVKNLVGKKHKHNFDEYCDTLKELGYTNYWQVLNAKDYGIPQNRERVYTISIRNDLAQGFEFPKAIPLEIKLKNILDEEVDNKYYLSLDKMERIAGWNSQGRPLKKVRGQEDIIPTITARSQGDEHGQTIYVNNSNETVDVETPIKEGYVERRYREFAEENGYIPEMFNPYHKKEIEETAQTITGSCGSATATSGVLVVGNYSPSGHNASRVISEDGIAPTVMENHGTVTAVASSNDVAQLGKLRDYGTAGQIIDAESPCTNTLTASMGTGGGNVPVVANIEELQIRKLTPKECWRLMGFTDSDFDKAKAAGVSDSQLYKQAGNSIVVNVLEHIFRNLLIYKIPNFNLPEIPEAGMMSAKATISNNILELPTIAPADISEAEQLAKAIEMITKATMSMSVTAAQLAECAKQMGEINK